MSAVIRSTIPLKPVVIGASRQDLRQGDVVTLSANELSHSSYNWTLAFKPHTEAGNPSTAALTNLTGPSSSFTVDNEGAYLVRLVVDQGLTTEDVQWVKLSYLTKFGKLKLVAGGERRDSTIAIPVDISTEGWANDQNQNLQTVLKFIRKISTSGRVFYVDANRGLDNSNPPNNKNIAEAYSDFSTISQAIAAAMGVVPPPSVTNPFIIKIHAGFYLEDVALQPHIHLVRVDSLPNSYEDTVIVRSQGVSGYNFRAESGSIGDITIASGITFENVNFNAFSTLDKIGVGTLVLDNCTILQNNLAHTQPSLLLSSGKIIAHDCKIQSYSDILGSVAYKQDGVSTEAYFDHCKLYGSSGADVNPTGWPDSICTFNHSHVYSLLSNVSSFGITSSAKLLYLMDSTVHQQLSTRSIQIHPLGNPQGSGITLEAYFSRLLGNITFNTTGVFGDTVVHLGAVEYTGFSTIGSLTEYQATVQSKTIKFEDIPPSLGNTVQDVLTQIVNILNISGVGGVHFSLDTAYDGILDLTTDPPTMGAGAGRTIVADQGAVKILAATSPISIPTAGETNGSLEVEGTIGLGATANPEIKLDPNPWGAGPEITLGNLVFPDVTSNDRAIPVATLRANSTHSPLYHNYHLRLETQSTNGASNGSVGKIILHGGDSLKGSLSATNASSLFLQGGENYDTFGGGVGELYLAPGYSDVLTSEGKVWFVRPSANTSATLTAANLFTGGVAGEIYFGISNYGRVGISILATDTLADVQTKFNSIPSLYCVINSANNPITISTASKGQNAEVYFAYDDQSSVLNTALGDFSISGGANFVAGQYAQKIAVGATTGNELTVFGDLNVTGTIIGTIASGILKYKRTFVNTPTYTVQDTDVYLGVDTSISVTIYLPDTILGNTEGRLLIIKDESGNATVNPITLQVGNPQAGLIDDQISLPLNVDWSSISMVSNGLSGVNTVWFIV